MGGCLYLSPVCLPLFMHGSKLYVHMHYVFIRVCTYMCTYMSMFQSVYMCKCVWLCVKVCAYVQICMSECTCEYHVGVYVYVCI